MMLGYLKTKLLPSQIYFSQLKKNHNFFRMFTSNEIPYLPCLSTEYCVEPPDAGDNIIKTYTDENGEQKVLYECGLDETTFFFESLNYQPNFTIPCSPNLILGGHFPYWQIPETEYPITNEIICISKEECFDYKHIEPVIKSLNLTDNFDKISFMKNEFFESYCAVEDDRGIYVHNMIYSVLM